MRRFRSDMKQFVVALARTSVASVRRYLGYQKIHNWSDCCHTKSRWRTTVCFVAVLFGGCPFSTLAIAVFVRPRLEFPRPKRNIDILRKRHFDRDAA